jgi:cyclohexanecarboxylate-CoA ligase
MDDRAAIETLLDCSAPPHLRRPGSVRCVVPEHRLVTSWARRYRDDGLWRGVALGDAFARTVAQRGDATMLVDGDDEISFRVLEQRVVAFADGLARRGVGQGDAVAYQLPNWWEAAVAFLATVRLGAHAVPIVPILRAREVTVILRQTHPRAIVVPARFRNVDFVAQTREVLRALGDLDPLLVVARGAASEDARAVRFADVCDDLEGVAAPASAPAAARVDASTLALVIYTSGSTAEPKGALHSHDTLTAEIDSLVDAHGLGATDRVLMPSPLTHVSGVIHGILAPALLGTSAVLQERWDPAAGIAAIERHGVTYMVGAPTFLQEMLASPALSAHDVTSLRLFSCGGASVAPELMRLGRARIPGMVTKRSYGSSEFPTIATTGIEDALARGLDTEGRALRGVELRVTDESGLPLDTGHEGEIRARGPECFLGYVDASLDADAFDADGFFRTGDLGVLDADGYLRVTGRVKDIIVRKGEKISAREVEDLLLEHPEIVDAALIPLADPATGERACACVQLAHDAAPLTLDALVAFLRARDLTPQKLPEQLELVDDFPRTPSGKINKRLLRDAIERRVAAHAEKNEGG